MHGEGSQEGSDGASKEGSQGRTSRSEGDHQEKYFKNCLETVINQPEAKSQRDVVVESLETEGTEENLFRQQQPGDAVKISEILRQKSKPKRQSDEELVEEQV